MRQTDARELVRRAIALAGSADKLAEALHYSRRTIFSWQAGEYPPPARAIMMLRDYVRRAALAPGSRSR